MGYYFKVNRNSALKILQRVTLTTNPELPETIPVTGVSITNKGALSGSLNADTQQTFTFQVSVSPVNASNKALLWSSSNTTVATVNASGVVTAQENGTTTITVQSASNPSVTDFVTVTCVKTVAIPVTSVTITNKLSIGVLNADTSQTFGLQTSVLPENASDKSLSWSSSVPSIATISASGVVTAKGNGSTTITVQSASNPSVSDSVSITCIKTATVPVTSVSITNKASIGTLNLSASPTVQLQVSVSPDSASDKSLSFSSSNPTVASVNSSGVVTALGAGSTTISARSNSNTSVSDNVTIQVTGTSPGSWSVVMVPAVVGTAGTTGVTDKVVDTKSGKAVNVNMDNDTRVNTLVYKTDGSQLAGVRKLSRDEAMTAVLPGVRYFRQSSYHPTESLVGEAIPYDYDVYYNPAGTGGYNDVLNRGFAFGVTGLVAGSYKLRILSTTSRTPPGGNKSGNCGILKVNGTQYPTTDLSFVENTAFYEFDILVESNGNLILSVENNSQVVQNYEYFVVNLVEIAPI